MLVLAWLKLKAKEETACACWPVDLELSLVFILSLVCGSLKRAH